MSTNDPTSPSTTVTSPSTGEPPLEVTINRETARISWEALAPHFASGNMISVKTELDLVLVAKAIANDNTEMVSQWMESGDVEKTSDKQAQEWQANNTELWAVVIKPWILVQVCQK